jgi:hypothetical protein
VSEVADGRSDRFPGTRGGGDDDSGLQACSLLGLILIGTELLGGSLSDWSASGGQTLGDDSAAALAISNADDGTARTAFDRLVPRA